MADDNVEINIEAKATLDTSEFDAGLSSISAQSKKINDEQKKSAGGILKTNTANSKIGGVGPQRALQRIYQQQNRQLQQQVRLVQQLAQNWQQIAQNAQQAQQAQQGGGGGGRPF